MTPTDIRTLCLLVVAAADAREAKRPTSEIAMLLAKARILAVAELARMREDNEHG